MVIKTSRSTQIDSLVKDLASDREAIRDAAIARLRVIGPRAVDKLVAVAADTARSAEMRAAALRALEGRDDAHSIAATLKAIGDKDVTVACAGISAGRSVLRSPHGMTLVDALTATAVDATRPTPVRVAAIRALQTLPASTIAPLRKRLQADADVDVVFAVKRPEAADRFDVAGPLDDAERVRHVVAQPSSGLSLADLHQLVERIRQREGAATGVRRAEWTTARAAVHAVLASRGSRLGVYDLRESLEAAAEPLPVEMLSALAEVGDASCLEAMAGAYLRVPDDWWRRHVVDAFRAIVTREKMTKRHAAIARIAKRYPQAIAALWRQ